MIEKSALRDDTKKNLTRRTRTWLGSPPRLLFRPSPVRWSPATGRDQLPTERRERGGLHSIDATARRRCQWRVFAVNHSPVEQTAATWRRTRPIFSVAVLYRLVAATGR